MIFFIDTIGKRICNAPKRGKNGGEARTDFDAVRGPEAVEAVRPGIDSKGGRGLANLLLEGEYIHGKNCLV